MYKPDPQYLKQAELDYSLCLENYHIACNSINNLRTILSIIVSLVGVVLSLIIPVLLDKNQFINYFSVEPETYPSLLISLFIVTLFMIIGGLVIFVTLFRDNASSLFEIKIVNQNLSHLPLLTRYKRLTQKLEEITKMISYKQDIYRKTIHVLIVTSVLVVVITLFFLNGLGSGEGSLNILLSAFIPHFTPIHTIPAFIWIIVTLSLIFHLLGFASVVFPFSNSRNFDKIQHKICSVTYLISYVLYVTLIIFSILTNIIPECVLLLTFNAGILMILPYGMSVLLTVYLLKVVYDLKKEIKMRKSVRN